MVKVVFAAVLGQSLWSLIDFITINFHHSSQTKINRILGHTQQNLILIGSIYLAFYSFTNTIKRLYRRNHIKYLFGGKGIYGNAGNGQRYELIII